MADIRFSHNWNGKLFCDVFTTIRKFTEAKYQFYTDATGNHFQVLLNDGYVCDALLYKVEKCAYRSLPSTLLRLDVGELDVLKIDDLFKKFGIDENSEVMVLTFKTIKEEGTDA